MKNRKLRGTAKFLIIAIGSGLLSSCAFGPKSYTATYGEVVEIKEDKVCVVYKVLNKKDLFVENCYYHIAGHSYCIGDIYPDFNKHQLHFLSEEIDQNWRKKDRKTRKDNRRSHKEIQKALRKNGIGKLTESGNDTRQS